MNDRPVAFTCPDDGTLIEAFCTDIGGHYACPRCGRRFGVWLNEGQLDIGPHVHPPVPRDLIESETT